MTTLVELVAKVRAEGATKTKAELLGVGKAGGVAAKGIGLLTASNAKLAIGFVGLLAAIKVTTSAMGFFARATQEAARFETLGTVMNTVAGNIGITADNADHLAKSVQDMGITMEQSRKTIISMAQAQLDLSKSSTLARVAQDAAVIAGIDSSQALNRIIHGLKSAQVETLRTMGINVNFQTAYRKLAAQLGKTSTELTETEKAQARLNSVMEEGERIAGAYESAMTTAGKKVTSLVRHMDDLKKNMGEAFTPAYALIIDEITAALKQMNSEMGDMQEDGFIEGMQRDISGFTAGAIATAKGIAAPFRIALHSVEGVTFALGQLASGNVMAAFDALKENGQEIIDVIEGIDDSITNLDKQRRTLTIPVLMEVDEFGVQQFKLITESFEELSENQFRTLQRNSDLLLEQKAHWDGIGNVITKIDNEISQTGGKALETQVKKLHMVNAESSLQKVLVEIEHGKLKALGEIVNLDVIKEEALLAQLKLSVAILKAKQLEVEDEKTLAIIKNTVLELDGKIFEAEAKIRINREGSAKKLLDDIKAAAAGYDAAKVKKQIDDQQFRISLIGKEAHEIKALTEERKLLRKGMADEAEIVKELTMVEAINNSQYKTDKKVEAIQFEMELLGKTRREVEALNAGRELRLLGPDFANQAQEIEDATRALFDLKAVMALESDVNPAINYVNGLRELHEIQKETGMSAEALALAESRLEGVFINQTKALGQLTAQEVALTKSRRDLVDLSRAANATDLAQHRQTTIDFMIREDELTKVAIQDQREVIRLLESKSVVNMELVREAKVRLLQLEASANKLGNTFKDIAEDSLEGFFGDIMDGSVSASEAFDNMVDSMVASITRLVAEALAQQAVASVMGVVSSGGGSSGGGGFLNTIVGAVGGYFTGGAGGAVAGGIAASGGSGGFGTSSPTTGTVGGNDMDALQLSFQKGGGIVGPKGERNMGSTVEEDVRLNLTRDSGSPLLKRADITRFASGGVMSGLGEYDLTNVVPFNKYASGGVARSTQVAVFGEGARAEAYVPLDDGRSIPVKLEEDKTTMRGGDMNVYVQVTKDITPVSARQTGMDIGRQVSSANRGM